MRVNLSIYEISEGTTKKGNPYWTVSTSEGKMSIFKEEVAVSLKEKGINKICDVEVEKNEVNGKVYNNITGFNEAKGEVDEKEESGVDKNSRLRRTTDCILSADQDFREGKIEKQEVFEHAKGLYNMIEDMR